MKERGIIFNADMVRAILDGRKTQTRRVVKFKPKGASLNINAHGLYPGNYRTGIPDSGYVLRSGGTSGWNDRTYPALCPFGAVGDRLWVRETWAEAGASAPELKIYRANYPEHVPSHYENVPPVGEIRWTPSIHMPRWASRITLEITDVRVERLNDISDADARAEGIIDVGCLTCGEPEPCGCEHPKPDAVDAYAHLWQSIYGEDSWFDNPWVWVIEFKRI